MARDVKPKLGNGVAFYPGPECGFVADDRPSHATIVRVNDDGTFNIRAIDGNDGSRHFEKNVAFFGVDAIRPASGPYIACTPEHEKFLRSAKTFEQSINDRGYTLEEAAKGDMMRDAEQGITREPLEPTADSAPATIPPAEHAVPLADTAPSAE